MDMAKNESCIILLEDLRMSSILRIEELILIFRKWRTSLRLHLVMSAVDKLSTVTVDCIQ